MSVCVYLSTQISSVSTMVDITNVSSEWFGNQLRRKRKEALNLGASEMEQLSKQSLYVKKPRRNYSKAENFNALMKGMIFLIRRM